MPKGREELRRGVRNLMEVASREMDALTEAPLPDAGPTEEEASSSDWPAGAPHTEQAAPSRSPRESSPILRLIRDTAARPATTRGPAPPSGPASAPAPSGGPGPSVPAPAVVHAPAAPPVAPLADPNAPPQSRRPQEPLAESAASAPAEMVAVHAKKGVCAAYYVNRACWEVEDAYCNQALHVCMLRECPVFHLNRDMLERRFAAKFSHLW